MNVNNVFHRNNKNDEDIWVSVSDIMSGLMIIFLFIAVVYMMSIKNVAKEYAQTKQDIYSALRTEFAKDLKKWNAKIDPEKLSIQFNSPEVLFDRGRKELKPEFKEILLSFFPRFINVLADPNFKDSISEIRIEGHTSKEGRLGDNEQSAFIYNMRLSQDRTQEVMVYLLENSEKFKSNLSWVRKNLTATGFSSSRTVASENNSEDVFRSRRVEFSIKTKSEEKILEILKR